MEVALSQVVAVPGSAAAGSAYPAQSHCASGEAADEDVLRHGRHCASRHDALFRALAREPASSRATAFPSAQRSLSLAQQLALSVRAGAAAAKRRQSMYMTTKETLARQYLAERRMNHSRRGWV